MCDAHEALRGALVPWSRQPRPCCPELGKVAAGSESQAGETGKDYRRQRKALVESIRESPHSKETDIWENKKSMR